jgi:hypothetical protein
VRLVRVQITQAMTGSIDGMRLDRFEVGRVYDVGTSLANYLLSCGTATPVLDESPALIVPIDPEPPPNR